MWITASPSAGVVASWQPSCDVSGEYNCFAEAMFYRGGNTTVSMFSKTRTLQYEPGNVTFRGAYDWMNPDLNERIYESFVCSFEIWSDEDEPVGHCYDLLDATVFEMHFLDNCTRYVSLSGEPFGTLTVEGPDAWKQLPATAITECVKSTGEEVPALDSFEDTTTLSNWQPTCDVSGAYTCEGRKMRFVDGAPVPEADENSVYMVDHSENGLTFAMHYEWDYKGERIEETALCSFAVWSDETSPVAHCFDGIDGSHYELFFDCDDDCGCVLLQVHTEPFGNFGEIPQGTPESWKQSAVAGALECRTGSDGGGSPISEEGGSALAREIASLDSWRPTCDVSGEWKCQMRMRQGRQAGVQKVDLKREETMIYSPEDDLTFSVMYGWYLDSPNGDEMLIEETEMCVFKPWSDELNPQAVCADAIDASTYTLQFVCDEDCSSCVQLQQFGEVFGNFDTSGVFAWSWEQGAVAGAIECTRA